MNSSTTVQKAALLFGIVFLVVGVAGFIPGITTEYDRLTNLDGVGALLLGAFGVSWIECVAHLAFGVVGLGASRSPNASKAYFLVGGVLYVGLWIYGLVIDLTSSANFLGVNEAANWLHFALGVVMIGIGAILGNDGTDRSRTSDI
jgi:arginine exporter protein ArgO